VHLVVLSRVYVSWCTVQRM